MKVMRFRTIKPQGSLSTGQEGFAVVSGSTIQTTKSLMACKQFTDVMKAVESFEDTGKEELIVIDESSIVYLAPVMPINNIFCIGKNYFDHILEFDGNHSDLERVKENPIFFTKALSSLNGHNQMIFLHDRVTQQVDYEAELGVIIGKECRDAAYDDAENFIYGYVIVNDVTARDLQKKHQQWFKGKSLDTFCPIGPFFVTSDEIADPHNLDILCSVNGEVRQSENTRLMIHNVYSQIEVLSKGMTLYPGDVISTGTPKGVGIGMDPPRFLKENDVVEISITHLGTLKNIVGGK